MAGTDQQKPKDVPSQIFDTFLANLAEAKVSDEVIGRLRKTLAEAKTFTDASLRKAILGES